jgi:hypothetical protein
VLVFAVRYSIRLGLGLTICITGASVHKRPSTPCPTGLGCKEAAKDEIVHVDIVTDRTLVSGVKFSCAYIDIEGEIMSSWKSRR